MTALTRAETEWTQWRGDYTLPGIMAKLEDGVGREVGIWVGQPGFGYTGERATLYVKGRNGQTTFSVEISPEDVRRLASSLVAMADAAERQSR